MYKYAHIQFRQPFAVEIEKRIKEYYPEFNSLADFVRYCVRKELDRIEMVKK